MKTAGGNRREFLQQSGALVVGFTLCATMASGGWYPFTRFSIEDVMP